MIGLENGEHGLSIPRHTSAAWVACLPVCSQSWGKLLPVTPVLPEVLICFLLALFLIDTVTNTETFSLKFWIVGLFTKGLRLSSCNRAERCLLISAETLYKPMIFFFRVLGTCALKDEVCKQVVSPFLSAMSYSF